MGAVGLLFFSIVAIVSFIWIFVSTLQFAESLSSQHKVHVYDPELHKDADFLYPLLIDTLLLLAFMGQHSGMATSCWKETMFDWGLMVIERSLYVFATAVALQMLMYHWLPLPATALWLIDTEEHSTLWLFFTLLHLVAWILIYGAALTMDFAELVGLKQVYYYSMDLEHPLTFKSRGAQKLYKHMRHPGTCCFLVILWVHPIMTLGRFFLAATLTLYLLFGHSVKESDYIYIEEQVKRKRITITRTIEIAE